MSDLISRSKLIEEIGELLKSPYANQLQFGAERREAIETVRDVCVKKQHTAYDIEKVVKELEIERKTANNTYNSFNMNVDLGRVFGLEKAIEIVKRGNICCRCREAGGCPIRDDCPNDHYENVCEWKKRVKTYDWEPSCEPNSAYNVAGVGWFKYCPYCGKKIKVVD